MFLTTISSTLSMLLIDYCSIKYLIYYYIINYNNIRYILRNILMVAIIRSPLSTQKCLEFIVDKYDTSLNTNLTYCLLNDEIYLKCTICITECQATAVFLTTQFFFIL